MADGRTGFSGYEKLGDPMPGATPDTPILGPSIDGRLRDLSANRRALVEKLLTSRKLACEIKHRDRSRPAPLSYAQQRMWFLDQLAGADPFYNIDYARRISAPVNFATLERALNEVVRRHESLRTTFRMEGERPVQIVAPELKVPLVEVDLSNLPVMRRETEAVRIAIEEARKRFDLANGPLLRTTLLRLAEKDYILLLTMHHIVCDAWSMMVFSKEMIDLYLAFLGGKSSPLPELPLQYADYAVWQREWLEGGVLEQQLAYWRKQLADLPMLQIHADRPRPAVQSFRGASWIMSIPADLTAGVKSFSQREGVTLFMTLLAAWQILLHRYSGEEDIVVGGPVANRSRPEFQRLIGCFVNTLILRTDLSGNPSVRELLARVQQTVSEAFANQDLPFEKLVEELHAERDASRNPLYQVSLQVFHYSNSGFIDSKVVRDRVHVDKGTATIDLALDLFDVPEGLMARVEYATDLFYESTIELLMGHLQTLLAGMVENPAARIGELPLLTETERRRLLIDWNATESDYARDGCVHDVFEQQARRSPNAVAIVSGDRSITYQELDRASNRLASHLQSAGVGPDVPVVLCAERSIECIIGLLAILKAGGAYVPLDPTYPKQRLASILHDTRAPVLLTQASLHDRLPETSASVVLLDHVDQLPQTTPRAAASSSNLAYVIYTSGSTGNPNGVMVEHRSLVNQILWMQRTYPLELSDAWAQKYSLAFDASLLEIFCPLIAGARVVLSGGEHAADPLSTLKVITANAVTVLDTTPSLLEAILEGPGLRHARSLRRIICGGEPMPSDLPRKLLDQLPVELINMYGPTECTINATSWSYRADYAPHIVPIGRPCANTQVYILDTRGNPAPEGVPGEIYVAGDGLARGYLRRPELTAERFVKNPFVSQPGARMFRTGDFGRHLPDGEIEFLGRADGQVKVHGYRIETGEVQAVIASHETVRSAYVTTVESPAGGQTLAAYIVPKPGRPEFWPSIGEYFAYDELTYYAMTHDEARNRAYRLAIERVVKSKTVVDIGTGSNALWARICVAEGAKHVYAIEMLDAAYEQAARLISNLGLSDRITLLHGDSMSLRLPERVDVCVSELIGTIASSEGVLPILNDARRFLKPGGTMIPYRCVTKIAATSLPQDLRERPRFSELTHHYAQRVFDIHGGPFEVRLCLKNLSQHAIISNADVFESLDFSGTEPAPQRDIHLTITRDGILDGFVLWINLYPSPDQVLDVILGEYSWLPVFFPVFQPGLEVQRGDRVEAQAFTLDHVSRTPDYRITGRVINRTGAATPFDYVSLHHGDTGNPFYHELLSAPPEPESGSARDVNLAPALRAHVRQKLPEYMVPSAFVAIKALPLTPSGKIDLRRLPSPEYRRDEIAAFVSATTEIEHTIARAWQEVLGIARVGVHDNFFDLGGHSLMIVRLQNRLQQELNADISLTDLFQYPTVAALASALESRHGRNTGITV
jgi:amino acid adenylation domain-containing protein